MKLAILILIVFRDQLLMTTGGRIVIRLLTAIRDQISSSTF